MYIHIYIHIYIYVFWQDIENEVRKMIKEKKNICKTVEKNIASCM